MRWALGLSARACPGGGRRRGLSPMSERQPLDEQPGCLLGRRPVEGHHGRRHAERALEMGSPARANWCDFNSIRAFADGGFDVMHGHVSSGMCWRRGAVILRSRACRSSEARREDRIHSALHLRSPEKPGKENFALSGCAQDLHGSCTGFPHAGRSAGLDAGDPSWRRARYNPILPNALTGSSLCRD